MSKYHLLQGERVNYSLCPPLCNSMDCTSLIFSVQEEILQARILEWIARPSSRGIFPTQGLNPGFLNCRQILSHLSHQREARVTTNNSYLGSTSYVHSTEDMYCTQHTWKSRNASGLCDHQSDSKCIIPKVKVKL